MISHRKQHSHRWHKTRYIGLSPTNTLCPSRPCKMSEDCRSRLFWLSVRCPSTTQCLQICLLPYGHRYRALPTVRRCWSSLFLIPRRLSRHRPSFLLLGNLMIQQYSQRALLQSIHWYFFCNGPQMPQLPINHQNGTHSVVVWSRKLLRGE